MRQPNVIIHNVQKTYMPTGQANLNNQTCIKPLLVKTNKIGGGRTDGQQDR